MRYANLLNSKLLNVARFSFDTEVGGPKNLVWLDIECGKVVAPEGWSLKTRTQAFMVGLAYYGYHQFVVEVVTGNEASVMRYVESRCTGKTIVYSATRSYDKAVLEGRWTFFRRAISETPGNWPHLSANLVWQNVRGTEFSAEASLARSSDVASKEVPNVWAINPDIVVLHNVRDLLEMVLADYRALPIEFAPEILTANSNVALAWLARYEA